MAEATGVDYDEEAAAEQDRITEENRRRLGSETTGTDETAQAGEAGTESAPARRGGGRR